jgi:hypothetical protein
MMQQSSECKVTAWWFSFEQGQITPTCKYYLFNMKKFLVDLNRISVSSTAQILFVYVTGQVEGSLA